MLAKLNNMQKRLDAHVLSEDQPNPVVERLLLKQRLLNEDDHAHYAIKTALVVAGGGMRGIYANGVTEALEALKLTNVFDNVVSISAGACTAAYFLAGQAVMATLVYSDDLTNKQFIDLRRFNKILDITFMENIFRRSKVLDQSSVRRNRAHLHIDVTDVETGEGEY